jgi:YNFM family putative membrane transporter
MGAFLALYLPQPLLPELDRDLGTPPAITGLVITATLAGFAVAGLLPDRNPHRTLRLAMWVTVASSLVAALSPTIWILVAARACQGVGVGLMVAGGLADVPRRMAPAVAGRVTGAMISGTAMGGLLGRLVGYAGLFVTWRGAFLIGALGVLAVITLSLSRLPRLSETTMRDLPKTGPAPISLLIGGAGILFVSVGMFDLLPYRLAAPPFHLPPVYADLVYLVFLGASVFGLVAGRALDRFGPRRLIVAVAGIGVVFLLVGMLPSLPALALAALAAICGTVGLHVGHSASAAGYGRAAVGRYLAAYYIGGAAAAPLIAVTYQRWGWMGVILPLAASWLAVAVLAATRQQPDRAQGQRAQIDPGPAGPLG